VSEFPSRRLLFQRLTPEESCRRASPALDARVPVIVKKPLAEVREVV